MKKRLMSMKLVAVFTLAIALQTGATTTFAEQSVARQWNEDLLEAIRHDFARPTVHARNLFHVSAAMWDAWVSYDPVANSWLYHEKVTAPDIVAAREEAISYAAYRLLSWRFEGSPGADTSLQFFEARMQALGYDTSFTSTEGESPAALGNRIARAYIEFGQTDGANEANDYSNRHYQPVNPALIVKLPGNPDIIDPNRYQPLSISFFMDQAGNPIPGGFPDFLSPEWGLVVPFSLDPGELTVNRRNEFDYWVYHDPGPPPLIGGEGQEAYQSGFEQVVEWSGLLDPAIGQIIDISPASKGNNTLGTNDGAGYDLNIETGLPYSPQVVPAGDYYRILAEFWADGPDSETPPGHWFTLANYVSDHPLVDKRIGGDGPEIDDLEWDLKLYFMLGGAMHDVAIASWGVKGWYDYVRPVSAIRYMADRGQSSDPNAASYDPEGIHLKPGMIELVTGETAAPGQRHEHLAGVNNSNVGKIAVYAWRGPDYISDPAIDTAGVGWILAENWWPYQRPSFVTPPFAGYVSGHSTYSRAAAEILSAFTGSEYFPGGMGEFHAPKNEFLVFEEGPSEDVILQWAKYYDASDECSLSRIYGGIHPPADDVPGRLMGARMGVDAYQRALSFYNGQANTTVNMAPVMPTQSPAGTAVFSGSWYDPSHNGEGWIIEVLDDKSALIYWFTYDQEGKQVWLVGLGQRSGNTLAAHMIATSGPVFGPDFDPDAVTKEDWGTLSITFQNCGSARVEYNSVLDGFGSGSLLPSRLTGILDLDCTDMASPSNLPAAGYTGSWYDPSHNGEGWILQILDDLRAVIYWFTYDKNGNQVWLIGVAQQSGNTLTAEMKMTSGPVFGVDFDPDALSKQDWGSLSMTFTSCDTATLEYSSSLEGFNEGMLDLERLTTLSGLKCE